MSVRHVNRLMKTIVRQQSNVYISRLYSRWSSRNPRKILLPFDSTTKTDLKKEKVIVLQPETQHKPSDEPAYKSEQDIKLNSKEEPKVTLARSKEIKSKKEESLQKRKFSLSQQKVFDDNNEIIYEKLKENDGKISAMLTNLKSKKERLRTHQVLVEGWRMIADGLEAKCKLNYIIFSRTTDLHNLRPFLPNTGVKFYKIPYKEIDMWSDVETSPGIFGVFEMPKAENIKRLSKPLPLRFVCDNVRVPGNLGAILRVAVGAGCDKVLLTKGCVDVWEPKVLRSAAGAHFRLPIHNAISWEDMPQHLEENSTILIADNNANLTDDETIEDKFDSMQIPVLPYYAVQYSTLNHVTLVIGGETEGISEDSYRLAQTRNGLRVNIPLSRGIDSLNTGMAAAVIAFEIRKQLIQHWTKLKTDRLAAEARGA